MTTAETITRDALVELISAAAVCAGERAISRRLARAVVAVHPELAEDVAWARGHQAQPLVPGSRQPAPITAADRVWATLDRLYGPAITEAALARLRAERAE